MFSKDHDFGNLDPILWDPKTGALLYQGDAKSVFETSDRFHLVVLCAEEFQPNAKLFVRSEQTRVLNAPNDDDRLTKPQAIIASRAAREVANSLLQGQRVLVTCMQGRNRSGLVSALALHEAYGVNGRRAMHIVRERRIGARALTNPSFNRFLERIPERHLNVRT